MRAGSHSVSDAVPLGIGYYTALEAARLLQVPSRSIVRWLAGYSYKRDGREVHVAPLWNPQLPAGDHLELGFRDLIELRFVIAFSRAGLGLQTIRSCLQRARDCMSDDRPFSTRRFQTDGRTIFLESLGETEEGSLLDLKQRQFVFRQAVEMTFRDLDVADTTVVGWRPFHGKPSIVIDPQRAFGQPIAASYGVPTATLMQAVEAEGSIERVARLFEVPLPIIRDAVGFEEILAAA